MQFIGARTARSQLTSARGSALAWHILIAIGGINGARPHAVRRRRDFGDDGVTLADVLRQDVASRGAARLGGRMEGPPPLCRACDVHLQGLVQRRGAKLRGGYGRHVIDDGVACDDVLVQYGVIVRSVRNGGEGVCYTRADPPAVLAHPPRRATGAVEFATKLCRKNGRKRRGCVSVRVHMSRGGNGQDERGKLLAKQRCGPSERSGSCLAREGFRYRMSYPGSRYEL